MTLANLSILRMLLQVLSALLSLFRLAKDVANVDQHIDANSRNVLISEDD